MVLTLAVLFGMGVLYATDNPFDRQVETFDDGYSQRNDAARKIYDAAKHEGRTLKVVISDPGGYVNFREEPIVQIGDAGKSNIVAEIGTGTELDVVLFRSPDYPGVDEVWGAAEFHGKFGLIREDLLRRKGEDGSPVRGPDVDIYDWNTGKIALWNVGQ